MTETSFGGESPLLIQESAIPVATDENRSGVSWAAIIAGAFVASAFSLALVALGAGIGLISVSPWSANNPSVTTFGALAAAWFIATQLFSSGVGGYVAGRLRGGWPQAHTDEVYFRDTAHGLLVWAVGAVMTAGLLALAASSVVNGAGRLAGAAAQVAGAAATGSSTPTSSPLADPTAYYADMVLRTDHPPPADQTGAELEVRRIFATALTAGDLPAADKTYLAQLVASRTGISQADAEKRVTDVFAQAKSAKENAANKAKEAADAARKTGVYVSLWAFISLLVGAVSASYMATVGGRTRDESPPVD
jgi:hypothetical protein